MWLKFLKSILVFVLGTSVIGSTVPILTACGEKKDEPPKEEIIRVQSVKLNKTSLKLNEGQTEQLTATVLPNEATNKNVTWESDNKEVATVDKNGLVTALKAGTAIITATADDSSGIKAKCTVTIKAPIVLVESIELESTLALTEGETDQLIAKVLPEEATNKNITWKSNNETVATVNKNGRVTALKEGFATIIASAEDGSGIEAKCTVTVSPITVYATGIELSATSFELVEGKTQQLTATISPENATNKNVTWSSSNEKFATVNAKTGLVKAVAPGETVIKATAADGSGITVECKVTVKAQIFAVEGVTLDQAETTLVINQKEQLTPIFIPQNATNKNVTWSSSNPEVALVDENGKVTAIAQGEATITVTTEDGNKTAECKVFVTTQAVAVEKVILDKTTLKLDVNQEEQLTPTVLPADATNKKAVWFSDNPNVAIVDLKTGLVKAIAAGEATITVKTEDGGYAAFCTVVVKSISAEKVELNKSEIQLFTGDNYQLTTTVSPSNATNKKVTWKSNDESIATVDQDGNVTAIAEGEATITVTTEDGNKFAKCKVTVKIQTVAVKSVQIDYIADTVRLNIGVTNHLTATVLPEDATNKEVTWSSSNPEVATIDQDGTIRTTLKEGTTNITVTTKDGNKTHTIKVVVVDTTKAASVSLNKTNIELFVGKEEQLIATVLPTTAKNKQVVWISNDKKVATVDQNGKVTALKEGFAHIIAIAINNPSDDYENDVVATCEVTIKPIPVEKIELNKETLKLKVGDSEQLTATVLPTTTKNKQIVWISNDKKVATVDQNGLVTALKEGFANIIAIAINNTSDDYEDDVVATCEVTVKQVHAEKIELNKETLKLRVGDSEQLTATVLPTDATNKNVTWSSSNPKIATVDQNGKVTAGISSVGTATITAITMDGVKASVNVVVSAKVLLDCGYIFMTPHESRQLTATVLPAGATRIIRWQSSKPNSIEVDQNGEVYAYVDTDAIITATTEDGSAAASCFVIAVSKSLSQLFSGVKRVEGFFVLPEIFLYNDPKQFYQIPAVVWPTDAQCKNIWWTSSNPNVVWVDPFTGKVIAIAPGTAIITATTWDKGFKATCKVTVIGEVNLNQSELELTPGTNYLLKATFDPQDATNQKIIDAINKNITWSSSNPEVASIDANGKVTAIAQGETTITVTTKDGKKTASCKVVVVVPVTSIELDQKEITMELGGDAYSLTATISPENATNKKVIWSSSNEEIATVDKDGKVTAKNVGETIVTATSVENENLKAECVIKVLDFH